MEVRKEDEEGLAEAKISYSQRISRVQEDEDKKESSEDIDAFYMREYGKTTSDEHIAGRGDSIRRMSKRLSRELVRRSSSITEQLPETPAGWAVFLSAAAGVACSYEMLLQRRLTCPPLTYFQPNSDIMRGIYEKMSASKNSILMRDIKPSLFVGTRGLVASMAAYCLGGPTETDQYIRFRQVIRMAQDGASIAVDWELPRLENSVLTIEQRISEIKNGPIQQPVVIILHGINNNANFGYMRSLMRSCAEKGWVAAGMNFRGCGGIPLTTPRGYNGAYTGDLRYLVQHVAARVADHVPVFLVGNSLGANLVAKYLGEEGYSGTLPSCVAGGITLGNPMLINSTNMNMLWSPLMALGVKRVLFEHAGSFAKMHCSSFQTAVRKAWRAISLADFDRALAPIFVRNGSSYPFEFRVGFKSGDAYWTDASSFRLLRYVSVPMLQLIAGDDFLVHRPFRGRLTYSLTNPNVMVVETKCGGHLGWQESPPDGNIFGFGTSWADLASTEFMEAAIDAFQKKRNLPHDAHSMRSNLQLHIDLAKLEAADMISRL